MVGLILLAVLAALIFFGVAAHFFSEMGIANWVAFLVVFGIAVAAVFPPLRFRGVSVSFAGFFVPLLLGLVLFFSALKSGGFLRTLAGIPAVAGIVLAARISFSPFTNYVPSMLIVGFVGAVAACLICKSRIAVLASLFLGIVLGDVIATLLFRYVLGSAMVLSFGQNGVFDAFMLGTLVTWVAIESANALSTMRLTRTRQVVPITQVAAFEAGEDNDFDKVTQSDEEDFDEYFNDDVD